MAVAPIGTPAAGESANNVTTLTLAVTVPSGCDFLVADGAYFNRTRSFTSVKLNGVDLTLDLRYDNGAAAATVERWYIKTPSAGSVNLVFTLDASPGASFNILGLCRFYSGVDQTTPFDVASVANVITGSHSSHSATITPVTNNAYVIDAILTGGTSAPTPTDAGQTHDVDTASSPDFFSGSNHGAISPAAITTMSWSFGATASASNQIRSALRPAAGGQPMARRRAGSPHSSLVSPRIGRGWS